MPRQHAAEEPIYPVPQRDTVNWQAYNLWLDSQQAHEPQAPHTTKQLAATDICKPFWQQTVEVKKSSIITQ